MRILALEFSTSRRSVAVLDGAGRDAVRRPGLAEADDSGDKAGGRGTEAFALIESALRECGLEREQIEGIVVGLGPGSYTGVRAAVSIAQGWQLARPLSVGGMSSVDCLAARLREEGVRGRAAVVVDAQRDEFYLARYELTHSSCLASEALRLATPAEVARLVSEGEAVFGPDPHPALPTVERAFPDAVTLARLAVAHGTWGARAAALEPIYLRETRFVKAPPRRVSPKAG